MILREAWPILEIADGPLTVNAIAARFRARYDSDEIGRALTMATKKGFLVNRKRKPQGYFIGGTISRLGRPIKIDFPIPNWKFVFLSFFARPRLQLTPINVGNCATSMGVNSFE